MAMRSPRSPAVCEVYESDCALGMIKMFHSGHGWPDRKLLSNGTIENRNPGGTGNSRIAHVLPDIGDKKIPTTDAGKASLQKIREDISTRHHRKRQAAAVDVQCGFRPSQNVIKKIASQKGYPTPRNGNRVMTGQFGNQSCSNNGRDCSGKRKKLNCQNFEELSEVNLQRLFDMTEASKRFAGRKFFNEEVLRDDGASYQSKQVIDALLFLKSNEEMFLKLVQDPNFLLAGQVHSDGVKGGLKSNSETIISDFRKLEKKNKHDFFWNKTESGPKGDSKSQTSDNKTLVFAPVLTSIQHSVSKSSCYRPPTLPFGNVRKKSKHYLGGHREEQHRRAMEANSSSHKTLDNLQVSGDGRSRLGAEPECAMDWKKREPDIYVEAKKHISKMLATRGKNDGYSRKQLPQPLEKILSLPSYDVSSKRCCRRETDHNCIHRQLSFPHFNNFTMVDSSQISGAMLCDEIGNQDFPCKCIPSVYSQDFSSPSNSSFDYPEEYLNHFKDKSERPSPVSILEPILPKPTTKQASKLPIQPSRINFDVHCPAIVVSPYSPMISSSSSMGESEITYEHLRGILLDKSLLDEAKLFLAQSCNDQKLLHDCISEVFLEVYLHEFKCSSWIADIQPMKRMSVTVQKHVLEKVIKAIDCGLCPQTPPPTLEQLLANDFAKPGAWIVVQTDTENIVVEMAEDILTELIKENLCELQAC